MSKQLHVVDAFVRRREPELVRFLEVELDPAIDTDKQIIAELWRRGYEVHHIERRFLAASVNRGAD